MKKFLFVLIIAVFSSFAVAANNMREQSTSEYIYAEGLYRTSAYPGTYMLLNDNYFPKKSNVVGVTLDILPEGFYYRWTPTYGADKVQLQVMPDTRSAYIGQGGDTDMFEFEVCIMDESTGHPISVRTFRFIYQENFTTPSVPRID